MSAYRTVKTRFSAPEARPREGAPMQGEWANTEGLRVVEARGVLEPLGSQLEITGLGQGSRQYSRWRGVLPDGVEPEPGWELTVEGRRYRVRSAVRQGGIWRLGLERIG